MRMRWWCVEVRSEDGRMLDFTYDGISHRIIQDQVSYDARMTAEEVKASLVGHDGYPDNIDVRLMK